MRRSHEDAHDQVRQPSRLIRSRRIGEPYPSSGRWKRRRAEPAGRAPHAVEAPWVEFASAYAPAVGPGAGLANEEGGTDHGR